jgi:hypothetical protein
MSGSVGREILIFRLGEKPILAFGNLDLLGGFRRLDWWLQAGGPGGGRCDLMGTCYS